MEVLGLEKSQLYIDSVTLGISLCSFKSHSIISKKGTRIAPDLMS